MALHLAVDLKCALADDSQTPADDLEVVSDDRFGSADRALACWRLLAAAGSDVVGANRLELLWLRRTCGSLSSQGFLSLKAF
jgi:hypothetical protein